MSGVRKDGGRPAGSHHSDMRDDHLIRCIARHAHSNRDRIAIMAPGRDELSYGGLHEQVLTVGAGLRDRGLGRQDRVAIVCPEGPDLATAILGTLAACVCAPLNSAFRLDEFRFYLEDMNASAVLLPAGFSSPVRDAAQELDIPIVEMLVESNGPAGVFQLTGSGSATGYEFDIGDGDDIALTLHTSGTTARPKCVALTQRNIAFSSGGTVRALGLTAADRCLNVMPLFHVHGLIGAMMSSFVAGASVVLPGRFDGPRIYDHFTNFAPTWYSATPAIHCEISDRAEGQGSLISDVPLRLIRSASAPLPADLLERMEKLFAVPVIEAYGMTEGSHQIASNPLPPEMRKAGSVGRMTGAEVAIIAADFQRLASGQAGEIILRGDTIISGYQNSTDVNAAAFCDGWLRTGDQGYVDDDGYIFITGRLKEIINRGGEKISPNEIEEVINRHPGVAQSGVFPVPHSTLGEDVAAAIVLRHPGSANAMEIQQFVATSLADFKVPRQIVFADDLPKSATGKTQRTALYSKFKHKITAPVGRQDGVDYVAPNTETEHRLAAIWADVLAVGDIGVDDSFFNLGGDSIQAVMVMSRVLEAFGVDLFIVAFFDEPSVRKMAAAIDRELTSGQGGEKTRLPSLRPVELQSAPLTFAQQFIHSVAEDPLVRDTAAFNRLGAISIAGALDDEHLRQAVEGIVHRHYILRARLATGDGEPRLETQPKVRVELHRMDLSDGNSDRRQARARDAAIALGQQPINLVEGPPVRFHLLRLGDTEHILVVASHLLIFDGWSMGVFIKELGAHYGAVTDGENPPVVAKLPVQYGDFAHWQCSLEATGALDRRLEYWSGELSGNVPEIDFDVEKWISPQNTFELAKQVVPLAPELVAELRCVAAENNTTLYILLLAALNILMARITKQNDVIVLSQSAGRTRSEIENLIGQFVNTFALCSRVDNKLTFLEYLAMVRRNCLSALHNEEVPFAELLAKIHPDRRTLVDPISPVLFLFKNFSMPNVAVGETVFEHLYLGHHVEAVGFMLKVYDVPPDLPCEFHYNRLVMSDDEAQQIASCYKAVLEQIVADPMIRVAKCLDLGLLIQTVGVKPIFAEIGKSLKSFFRRL